MPLKTKTVEYQDDDLNITLELGEADVKHGMMKTRLWIGGTDYQSSSQRPGSG